MWFFPEQSYLTNSLTVSGCTFSYLIFPASFPPGFSTGTTSKHWHRAWEKDWLCGGHVDIGPALITAPTVYAGPSRHTIPEAHSFLPQLAPTWARSHCHAQRGPAWTPDVGGMPLALLLSLFLIRSSIKTTTAMRHTPGSILQDN